MGKMKHMALFSLGSALVVRVVLVVRLVGYEPFIFAGASRDWFEYEMFDHIKRQAAMVFVVADLSLLVLVV